MSFLGTSCSNSPKENLFVKEQQKFALEDKVLELKLEYIGLMCACPQWATPENIELYCSVQGTSNVFPMDSVFMVLERKDKSLPYPFKMKEWDGENVFRFKGQFYKQKRKWKGDDGVEWNTKVFRYESCEIIKD